MKLLLKFDKKNVEVEITVAELIELDELLKNRQDGKFALGFFNLMEKE